MEKRLEGMQGAMTTDRLEKAESEMSINNWKLRKSSSSQRIPLVDNEKNTGRSLFMM